MDLINNYSGVILGREKHPQIAGVTSAVDLPLLMPLKNWDIYRPIHEEQNKGYETAACTLFSAFDCVETLLNYHLKHGDIPETILNFLKNKGYIDNDSFNFSDRFAANFADIIPLTGTYQWKANNALANYLIPEKLLPYTTIGEYKNPDPTKGGYFNKEAITQGMLALAKEIKELITINWFYVEDKSKGLMTSP